MSLIPASLGPNANAKWFGGEGGQYCTADLDFYAFDAISRSYHRINIFTGKEPIIIKRVISELLRTNSLSYLAHTEGVLDDSLLRVKSRQRSLEF